MESSKAKQQQTFLVFSYVFFVALLFLRGFKRLSFPQIVNEDALIFLPQALSLGAESLFTAFAGYFHTMPRLIALLAVQFPPEYWAFILTLACFLLLGAICLRVTFSDFEENLGPKAYRVLVAAGLLCMSGLNEGLANPTNLHWLLSIYIILLALRNKGSALSAGELLLTTLAIASAGETLAFAPVFALRIFRHQSKSDMWILANIGVFAILNIAFKESGPPLQWSTLERIPQLVTYGTMNQLLWVPLAGSHIAFFLAKNIALVYWVGGLGLIAVGLRQIKRQKLWVHLSLFLCLLAFMLMLGLAREHIIHFFDKMLRPVSHRDQRYSIIPSAVSFLLISSLFLGSSWRRFFPVFLFLYVLLRTDTLVVPLHEPIGASWKERVTRAQQLSPEQDFVEVDTWPPKFKTLIPNKSK